MQVLRKLGRRAWERLTEWSQERGHPDDGDAALTALSDIGDVRRLLDQAELVAVRTARRHRKAWAEIATRLGVTRQSAWERWRDLDHAPSPSLDALIEREADVVVERAVNRRVRAAARDLCVVPDAIGMTWDDARTALLTVMLVAVGSPVTLWVERGGGAGDREPRLPTPAPRAGRALHDDLPDELSGKAADRGESPPRNPW